jgi:hypothetical protein
MIGSLTPALSGGEGGVRYKLNAEIKVIIKLFIDTSSSSLE